MPRTVTKLRVFVGSPSDVAAERLAVRDVIEELNASVGTAIDVVLEWTGWELAVPAMGRPQQVILDQIQPEDIFIGIMWSRFGSPTGTADSGTEEEFYLAYKSWEHDEAPGPMALPRIMFYFNKARVDVPRDKEGLAQLSKVLDFQTLVEGRGLVTYYNGVDDFRTKVRGHLSALLMRWRQHRDGALVETPLHAVVQWIESKTQTSKTKAVVMFSDVEGFSRVETAIGSVRANSARDDLVAAARKRATEFGGLLCNARGDHLQSAFMAAPDALSASVLLHRDANAIERRLKTPFHIRIGLHEIESAKNLAGLSKSIEAAYLLALGGRGNHTYTTDAVYLQLKDYASTKDVVWYQHDPPPDGPLATFQGPIWDAVRREHDVGKLVPLRIPEARYGKGYLLS